MIKEIIAVFFIAVIAIILLVPPPISNVVHKWEPWNQSFSVVYPYQDNNVTIGFNVDESVPEISTRAGDLRLNGYNGVSIPYGKYLSISDLAGFDKLYLSTVGGSHSLVSTGKNLRITTYRNLEIKASNTIFPAVNAITYLLASNAARYHELRAVYGTGTASANYVSIYHNGTIGIVDTSTGSLNLARTKGNVTIGNNGVPGCIQIRDSDNGGWSKCISLSGTLSCSVGTC